MTMPFYVSPEQLIKDRADFAYKGVTRGRPVVVVSCAAGILFVSHNPSRALHKISEIYDRIGFAAVGKFNEFEALRVAGIRYADLRGYSYDRSDVAARGLAHAYAQTLGAAFTTESKPLEVELAVGEVHDEPAQDQIYRISFDGSVSEIRGVCAMGASAESVIAHLDADELASLDFEHSLQQAYGALTQSAAQEPSAVVTPDDLEVAVLHRVRAQRRRFQRLTVEQISQWVGDEPA